MCAQCCVSFWESGSDLHHSLTIGFPVLGDLFLAGEVVLLIGILHGQLPPFAAAPNAPGWMCVWVVRLRSSS